MEIKTLLNQLEVGSAVAEFDNELERYFVETPTFRALVEDKVDVIAGDKGTGKTALFRILSKRYTQLRELDKVEIVWIQSNRKPRFPKTRSRGAPERGRLYNHLEGLHRFSRWKLVAFLVRRRFHRAYARVGQMISL